MTFYTPPSSRAPALPAQPGRYRRARRGRQVALDAEELAAWDEPGALAEVRGRFVNDETDAAVVKQAFYSGDADAAGGEAAYGDFEDVETGEVFGPGMGDVPQHIDSGDSGDEGAGAGAGAGGEEDGEEDGEGGAVLSEADRQAELMRKKLEKRRAFDASYDGELAVPSPRQIDPASLADFERCLHLWGNASMHGFMLPCLALLTFLRGRARRERGAPRGEARDGRAGPPPVPHETQKPTPEAT